MLLRSSSQLLRALGNEGDGVSPSFPKGQQNGGKKNFYNSSLRLISVWFEQLEKFLVYFYNKYFSILFTLH
jgi:hypothetical protein